MVTRRFQSQTAPSSVKPKPKFQGGFGLNATYKWFDLTANFNFVVGNDVYNLDKMVTSQSYRNTYASLRQEMTPVTLGGKAWTYMDQATGEIVTDYETLKNMNANASIWSAATLSDNNPVPSSWAVEDGSFLRLQNLTVGFTFPKEWTKKVRLQLIAHVLHIDKLVLLDQLLRL